MEDTEAPQICSHKLITTQTLTLLLIWDTLPGSSTMLELLDQSWTVLVFAPLKGLSDEKHQYALNLFYCSIQHKCSIRKLKIQAFLSFSVDLFF